jgi:GMP synthase (glutamine-hydrolysing)
MCVCCAPLLTEHGAPSLGEQPQPAWDVTEAARMGIQASPKVLVVQHVAEEPPGVIGEALEDAGLEIATARVFRGDAVPVSSEGFSAVVLMGGPMGVHEADNHRHLWQEMQLIESALRADVPLLGICLGSQLLAAVLGAKVAPAGFLEVGWFPVTLEGGARDDALLGSCPRSFTALHWHGDAFELPAGAVHLARSEKTAVQAFRSGRAYGLLFHAEVDAVQLAYMARAFESDVAQAGTTADAIAEGALVHGAELRSLANGIFGRFAGVVRGCCSGVS